MSENIKQPYIGVSGVTSPEMQATLVSAAESLEYAGMNRILALGVKAVHKTQYLDVENKYGREWYPVGEAEFSGALIHDKSSPGTIAVAQTYLDVEYVSDVAYREDFIKRVNDRGASWIQGIQFDMLPWHNNSDMLNFLEDVKSSTNLQIFLQAHGSAMAELGPKGVVKRLKESAHVLDYLLFDASHGTGKRLNVDALVPFVAEAYDAVDPSNTGVAIAGGLNDRVVVEDLPRLVETYPELSWDAEGQLHPQDADGKRPLSMSVTYQYMRASIEILKQQQ